jgi:hypothetical protein
MRGRAGRAPDSTDILVDIGADRFHHVGGKRVSVRGVEMEHAQRRIHADDQERDSSSASARA